MTEPTLSYVNEYLYIMFRGQGDEPAGDFLFCSGTNLRRFHPVTHGRHARAMNPAFRGLQLLRFRTVVPAVIARGGRARQVKGDVGCDRIAPGGDGWFRESLIVSGLHLDSFRELLDPCVRSLAQFVLGVCFPGIELPEDLSDPVAFQRYLDTLAYAAGMAQP